MAGWSIAIQQDRELSGESRQWGNWESALLLTSCKYCVEKHGTVAPIQMVETKLSVHSNCYCVYVSMRTKAVGQATDMGLGGADAALAYMGRLPEYYVGKNVAKKYGWKSKSNDLDQVLPGYMIGGDVYQNDDKKLPDAPGRVWYEADINYEGGFRNRQRVLYSNDGLLFATYDHYHTFYEIVK